MSFQNLKSSRGSSIDKLVKAAEAVSTPKTEQTSYEDNRIWKPTRDKAGNGYAVIRFLPAKEGEDLPWVRYWDHGFKGPTGQWYIENSLTSIGQPDPVSESNTILWNSGRDSTPEAVKKILDKEIPGFGEIFRYISFKKIGTSSLQSRAIAGLANDKFIFALPGSPGACKDAWDDILKYQLDSRTKPCNLVELIPRIFEQKKKS